NVSADPTTTSVPTVVRTFGRTCMRISHAASGPSNLAKPSRTAWGIRFIAGRSKPPAARVSIGRASVEQITGLRSPEAGEVRSPRPPDRGGRAPCENRPSQVATCRPPVEARRVEAQRVPVYHPKCGEQRHRRLRGIVASPVRHAEPDAAQLDSIVFPVCRRPGSERHSRDLHAEQPFAPPPSPFPPPPEHRRRTDPP